MTADQSSQGTERTPTDPFDPDDAKHIDKFPPFNGDRKASFAYDAEGNRYKVVSGDRFPSTYFVPEEQWRENVLPEREGVGAECAGCGEKIEWDAIIVNSEWHLRCYADQESDRRD